MRWHVSVITRLRLDVRLFDLPPLQLPGTSIPRLALLRRWHPTLPHRPQHRWQECLIAFRFENLDGALTVATSCLVGKRRFNMETLYGQYYDYVVRN